MCQTEEGATASAAGPPFVVAHETGRRPSPALLRLPDRARPLTFVDEPVSRNSFVSQVEVVTTLIQCAATTCSRVFLSDTRTSQCLRATADGEYAFKYFKSALKLLINNVLQYTAVGAHERDEVTNDGSTG